MDKLEVFGARKLKGNVRISGSKNAALPILAATILSNKKIVLNNLPNVKDIETIIKLLESIGSIVKYSKNKNSITIQNKKKLKTFASYNFLRTMRGSFLVLGSMLARYGNAKVSTPGGCSIGVRPIDLHLKALSKLGVNYKIIDGYVYAHSKKKLKGAKIKFPKISVGATENLVIASSMAEGTTILSNCAIEPEIKDLVNFINCMGGKIKWIGKRTLKIVGVKNFKDVKYKIMPDRIEAGTYLIAAAVTEGNLKILGINPKIISTEIDILKKLGMKIKVEYEKINIEGTNDIKTINLKTAPYPGFATDIQGQLMVLLCKSKKRSVISEEIFENRFMHVAELNRMGAKIKTKGNKAFIEGNTHFKAAEVMATDLRASVSLILAGLAAKGKTTINRIYHLDRGYEQIEKKLRKVGARIRRVS